MDGTAEERIKQYLMAKYKAGLLKPFDYQAGYTKLKDYITNNLSPSNKERMLQVLKYFNPNFRHIAQALTDEDFIIVEGEFERILLHYDRIFSMTGIAACLWRRTGEILRGNTEFRELTGISREQLKNGTKCIYELMTEDSLVNYWEQYGNVAFNPKQKAVLSKCVIKKDTKKPHIACCFSFTIKRDQHAIPIAIIGNFIPIVDDDQ